MKALTTLLCTFAFVLCAAAADTPAKPQIKVADDGFPSGTSIPEGAACDLARAFIKRDDALFTNTCIRPYGIGTSRTDYTMFLAKTVATIKAEAAKNEPSKGGPKSIGKVFAARHFTKNGPASYGSAAFNFQDIMFVDVGVYLQDGKPSLHRTLVIKDSDGKWYVHPLPHVSPLLSTGINEELTSTRDFTEVYDIQK